jgi:hypothetical protein
MPRAEIDFDATSQNHRSFFPFRDSGGILHLSRKAQVGAIAVSVVRINFTTGARMCSLENVCIHFNRAQAKKFLLFVDAGPVSFV